MKSGVHGSNIYCLPDSRNTMERVLDGVPEGPEGVSERVGSRSGSGGGPIEGPGGDPVEGPEEVP